jgi:small subunit ribosomal protein S20
LTGPVRFVTFHPEFSRTDKEIPLPAKTSAEKRHAQSERNHLRNKSYKTMLKTRTKGFLDAVASGSKDSAQTEYRTLAGLLDQAVTKGIVHKNTAARKKSRMGKALNRI